MELKGTWIPIKRIAQFFFLLGVFAKQFYLLPSGTFQIGDALMMGSMMILLLLRDWRQLKPDRRDFWLMGFVLCVVIINGIYILIYGISYSSDFRFHMSILNYIYILLIVMLFRQFCEDVLFLRNLRRVLQAAILVQTIFCLLDLTERYDGSRFVGTFNDPNQCGFFLMSAAFLVYLISKMTDEGHPWLFIIPAAYCIFETSSTGMMLGMVVFLAGTVFWKISTRNVKSAIAFLMVAAILLVVVVLFLTGELAVSDSIKESMMYKRLIGKFETFGIDENGSGSMDLESFIADRSMEKIVEYPERMLFGAGEGYFNRLPAGPNIRQEIHSSIFGPLFYYGIIPCMMWFVWTAIQLKGTKRVLWSVYLALIIESVTLVNNRQPFFWMIFVLAGSCLAKRQAIQEPQGESVNKTIIKLKAIPEKTAEQVG